jgi:trk system potassium uptake protein
MKPSRYKLREIIYKQFFVLLDFVKTIRNAIRSLAVYIFTLSTILFICLLLFDLGFKNSLTDPTVIREGYIILLTGLCAGKAVIEIFQKSFRKWILIIIKALLLLLVFYILLINYEKFIPGPNELLSIYTSNYTLIISSTILILTETYRLSDFLNKINIAPWIVFAGSFLIIILIGSGLLMMPNATSHSISYLEALFTSTSAVCVTGLVVVDTATTFTEIGKGIILMLIQIGGLGIMAFTGFFSFAFSGSASFRQRIVLKDLFSGEQLGSMFRLLTKILFIMLLIEGFGTLILYYSLKTEAWNSRFSTALFHSVSAFCNAGFSTLHGGMAGISVQTNRLLQLTICSLIILGGLGFPVLLIFYNFVTYNIKNFIYKLARVKRDTKIFPFLVSQNLALKTTIILLLLGTVFYFLFERDVSLQNMDRTSQWITAFFGSTSARTAGFNISDIARWSYPTIFLMIFLMWVGASPGSTGGGIKTTTFALALKSTFNFIRGRKYLEIENREIGVPTLMRVLSTIMVSILVIFIAFFLTLSFDPFKNPIHLLFECVSAFSTVGLSVSVTATLSINSKIVLIFLMFIGRIGPVILLSGIFLSKNDCNYRLPVENIAIN